MTPQIRRIEHNIFGQQKTQWKCYTKGHYQCCIIGLQSNKTKMNNLLIKYEIKADIKKKNIKEHITTPADGIAKCLQREKLFEGRIKKINKGDYFFFHSFHNQN